MIRPNSGDGRRSVREWAFVNASSNMLGTGLTLAVWFFVTPVILHHLGVGQYGLWVLATAIVAYAPLLDLGIGDAITRYVATHQARDDSQGASRFIAAGLWIYLGLALLTLALTAILAPFFGQLFDLPHRERVLAEPVIALAGLNVAVAFPAITNLAVLRGIQRFDLVNIVGTGSTILTGIAIVIVLHAGGNVVALSAIGAPMELLSQIPMLLFIRRAAPQLQLRVSHPGGETTRMILVFGAAQAVIRIGQQVRTRSDEIIVGAIRSIGGVARYGLVRRLTAPAINLSDQLLDTLLPLASQLYAQNDRARLRELMLTGTRAALGSYLMVGVSLALLADPFLRAWVGKQYVGQAGVAPLLVGSGLMLAAMAPAERMLTGMRKLRTPLLASVAGAVCKVGLGVGLGLAYGVVGVATASLIAGMVTLGPVALRGVREVAIPLPALFRQAVVPSAIAALGAAGVVLGARWLIGQNSIVAVLADGAAGSATFGVLYLLAPAASLEREMCAHLLRLITRRHPPRNHDGGTGSMTHEGR